MMQEDRGMELQNRINELQINLLPPHFFSRFSNPQLDLFLQLTKNSSDQIQYMSGRLNRVCVWG